jgi:hypothetical protein
MSDACVILEAELPGGRSEAELRNEGVFKKSLLVAAVLFRWNREGSREGPKRWNFNKLLVPKVSFGTHRQQLCCSCPCTFSIFG